MAYNKQTWVNGPGGNTPVNAARLGFMETGIEGAHSIAEAAASTASGAATTAAAAAGTATTVSQALGNSRTFINKTAVLAGVNDIVGSFNINDDGTPTGDWPNRLQFSFGANRLTGWFGEYGELRCMCAKDNTVAFRAFGKQAETDARSATVPIAEVVTSRNVRTPLWGVLIDGTTYSSGPIERRVPNGPVLRTGHLILTGGAAVPANTPANTLIIRPA